MEAAAQVFTKALIIGLDHASRKTEFAEGPQLETLPFEEAVGYMSKRGILDSKKYYELEAKERFRAFTVSRLNDGDTLEKVKTRLSKALENGTGLDDFLSQTREQILEGTGFAPGDGWYWETVYRTNIQTSYNVGRAIGFQEDPPEALEFIGVEDTRQTPTCRGYTNPAVILPYTDTFWKRNWPPLHFNCRSTVRAIYDMSEIEGKNGKRQWSRPTEEKKHKNGFGTYPLDKDDWWQVLPNMEERAKKYAVLDEIRAAEKRLIDKKKELENRLFKTGEKADFFRSLNNERKTTQRIVNRELEKELSEEEALVVYAYTSGDIYFPVNKYLLSQPVNKIEYIEDYTEYLNITMEHLSDYEGIVYRGQTGWEGLGELKKDNIIKIPSFWSTDKKDPFEAEYMIQIESKTGKDLKQYSIYKNEDEVLYKPGTRFIIKEVESLNQRTYILLKEVL